ncbi:Glycosyltransferase involved in cell wall bisynthesis [Nitrosospira sp. Nsp14]|uniref:glycosyltransferase family 2 protein n=1 Tax=Nitrosospira sp. Nsp14 TaxID=1855333 RepID=UPI0008F3EBA1|nr:glycosyltransferase family 2 protein [Nitrosospira sp. Nsp14]SFH54301.1 Glycosyltransferase involved in cell wall bisynthesis [Nitrosospira sp. Nsp14]
MTTPLSLSVALASYNGERYIGEQLDSIARQTRLPDELVICDDASTDSTEVIVREFARRAPFAVRFLQHERMGSTRNFELAIAECRGDIIFLCDQDDVWYPDKVKTIEAVFIDRPETGAVFTDADVVDENLQPLGSRLWKYFRFKPKEQAQVEAGDALSVLLRHPVATGATMAFRSSFRDFLLSMPPTWHDAWIALLIGTTSHLVALPTPLIAYRQHGHNQVGIPRPGRNRDKTVEEIYGPRVLLYERARARLLEFADRFPTDAERIYLFNEVIKLLRARATLPIDRWRRLPMALQGLIAYRYHRYAYGWGSFLKDLFR